MRRKYLQLGKNSKAKTFKKLWIPIVNSLPKAPPLVSQGDRPLKMTFEDQLKALVFFHLEEHTSGTHLIEVLEKDDFVSENIALEDGVKKAVFSKR